MKIFTFLIFIFITNISFSQVIISELQSSNTATIKDDFEEYEDWIEIFNPNDTSVDIGGMVLKDNVDVWRIPTDDINTIIPPNGFFILWADDEEFQGKFHTNFKLSAANGEFFGLFKSDSLTVIDSVNIPPLLDNQTYGVCNDKWMVFNTATPLESNDCISSEVNIPDNFNLLIYPSIVKNNLNIDLPVFNGEMINVFLFSTDGKLLLNQNFNSKSFTLNLSNFNNGLYIIKTYIGEFCYTERIIKK